MGDTCEHIQQLLPWFVAQTLDVEEKLQVFEHLRTCAMCRQELVEWMAVRQATHHELDTHLDSQVATNTWNQLQTLIGSGEVEHESPRPSIVGVMGTLRQTIATPIGVLGMTLGTIRTECARPVIETFTRTAHLIRGAIAMQS